MKLLNFVFIIYFTFFPFSGSPAGTPIFVQLYKLSEKKMFNYMKIVTLKKYK